MCTFNLEPCLETFLSKIFLVKLPTTEPKIDEICKHIIEEMMTFKYSNQT